MDVPEPEPESRSPCPNCASPVAYRGVGRRPIWCSTRCRNDAALIRLGARRGGVEVRIVDVPRLRPEASKTTRTLRASPAAPSRGELATREASVDQGLRAIRDDPVAVGDLLVYLERRRADGTLSTAEWLPVRNALRSVARALTAELERPAESPAEGYL
ncbi:hypothetical protein GCM10023339_18770 [Alloalcanivorax gelatiniphagus]